MSWTQAEVNAVLARQGKAQKPSLPPAKGKVVERQLNNTEAAYAQYLELRRKVGDIAWWAHEPIRVRLAKNTFFVPDFMIMLPDGTLELHDTKGAKKVTRKSGATEEIGYTREDAQMKMKIAAELLPIPLRKVWRTHSGEWESRLMP